MTTEFKLHEDRLNVYEMEHYVLHMLSELNSKRNDGWMQDHYKKELSECGIVIDNYIQNLNEVKDETIDWVKNYEKEKLSILRKKINEV